MSDAEEEVVEIDSRRLSSAELKIWVVGNSALPLEKEFIN